LSRTIPEIVASVLLELPASIGAADIEMSASRDKLEARTLLMRYDLRYESQTGRRFGMKWPNWFKEETYQNQQK
jgi:hypothetical protein